MTLLESSNYTSPIGDIRLLTLEDQLCYLDFDDNTERLTRLMKTRFGEFSISEAIDHAEWHARLDRYFSGDSEAFSEVALNPGGTAFQRKVWDSLRQIPHGETLDYSALAALAGNAKAVRAAASSNARNPISIVVPCHRVIGKDGSLRGYAGGEDRKRWLLVHEGAWDASPQASLIQSA